ncbi:helix-turn-helix domain-containing protein [Leifsonia sp. F6_8S_P_1B]|uniref:Helix-turn-helix domain-containing protein n=1 Tax=Leifsonia williamsii TaxID=3035919 RepID=A0ABT8K9X7_9MICO|nr:helix-turn-helix domain-containing protein [Leifsonia williamsii]MDN4614271.1 helix-turn-helix domain-containing protein [Leifsonia williamsii]
MRASSAPQQSAMPRSNGQLTPSADVAMERRFPSDSAAVFVRHYWLPRWSLPEGRVRREAVLEYPSANVAIEPRLAALHRANRGLSTRTLTGTGWAFGALLRPGVALGWTGGSLRSQPLVVPLGALGNGEAAAALAACVPAVRAAMAAGDGDAAITAFESALATLPSPGEEARLVDAIVAAVEEDRELRRVEQLAERFGIGVRSLQRLIAGHLGFGPKWLIQRYRLQEAAAALRSDAPPPLALLAADLGYADQAHFSREFKAVIGATPGGYAAQAAATSARTLRADPPAALPSGRR